MKRFVLLFILITTVPLVDASHHENARAIELNTATLRNQAAKRPVTFQDDCRDCYNCCCCTCRYFVIPVAVCFCRECVQPCAVETVRCCLEYKRLSAVCCTLYGVSLLIVYADSIAPSSMH